jgi:hypothetical protein
MNIILYPQDEGYVKVTPNLDCGLNIEQIALKDVPFGLPFLIVDSEAIPEEPDFLQPYGFGADYGAGSRNAVIGWNADGSPMLEMRDDVQ